MVQSDSSQWFVQLRKQSIMDVNNQQALAHFTFQQKVEYFQFYSHYIICKCYCKVLVYNTLKKKTTQIKLNHDQFTIHLFAPFIFVCLIGKQMHMYSEQAVINHKQKLICNFHKLQVLSFSRYNKGYYMGGYNQNILGKRINKRQIYYIEDINLKGKNKADCKIKLQKNENPIQYLIVQIPFLLVYCQPQVFILSVTNHEILLTFHKDLQQIVLIEGRYAKNCLNGIGISNKKTMFCFDFEIHPIFGVEIIQHPIQLEVFCIERTGKIYAAKDNILFQYNPNKKIKKTIMIYNHSEFIISLRCSPKNNLMILRKIKQKQQYQIDVLNIK